jgi:glycosyltransferase involved in cell wall biosynthesis
LICVSEQLRRDVAATNPRRTKLDIYPVGVELPASPVPQTGPLRLVYAGRLTERASAKRVGLLVEALIRVLGARPEISAKLIGSGEEQANLERRVAEAGLSARITFTGHVEPDRIHAAMADCHVLVLLSDHEGQPGAVIDGMAAGLVPVCKDLPGGLRDLVIHESTGLLVPDRDASFLAAITRLADDLELRQRLARNAREHIARGFSLAAAADRWEAFCGELPKERGERRPIRIPWRLDLPPVHPGLESEDHRRVKLRWRAEWLCKRIANRILGRSPVPCDS